jgi:hypothetical protein
MYQHLGEKMRTKQTRFPPLFIVAYSAVAVAIIVIIGINIFPVASHIFRGVLLLSTGLTLFGIGEILNHPKETFYPIRQDAEPGIVKYYRRRNSCGLGTLCDIVSLLFFFMALSSLFFSK